MIRRCKACGYEIDDSGLAAARQEQERLQGERECPITRRPFFMMIEHPALGRVATFGGPFDSYTIPVVDEDGYLHCERYDHDRGSWIEGGEPLGWYVVKEGETYGDAVERYERLVTALRRYGRHLNSCPANPFTFDGSGSCNCGLDAALPPVAEGGRE